MSYSRGANIYVASTTPTYINKDIGELVKSFAVAANKATEVVTISDVQVVGSYSWIDAKTPTIAVPGSPKVWTNTNPKRVAADSGVVFIDQNAHRMGRTISPLTPIFAAIDDLHDYKYKYDEIDIISDRNNLRKLLRWATGVTQEKGFRIDIELAGQTCLFTRCEETDTETVQGFKGFGHNYKEAATRPQQGCEKATGHHRIISINFGGLKILLRFEVGACTGASSDDPDNLSAALSALSIKPSAETSTSTQEPIAGVSIIRTTPRKPVAQSTLIELKTRAAHRPLDWAEVYPQLYLSQTTYLYLAKHNRGNFGTVEKIQLAGDSMKVYAEQAEVGMGKLEVVLTQVLEAVRKEGEGVGMSLISERNSLVLYKRGQGTGKAVGSEILSRFA